MKILQCRSWVFIKRTFVFRDNFIESFLSRKFLESKLVQKEAAKEKRFCSTMERKKTAAKKKTANTEETLNLSCTSFPWGFKLYLVDLQRNWNVFSQINRYLAALCKEFQTHFELFKDVSVVNGKFESLPEFDCMVSAGNSFGLMDGGVDAAITLFFGGQLQKKVQKYILENFEGEQPVGTSFIIETDNDKHPYLAHTPTMDAQRVPYSIEGTDYVYLAMKAMLSAVKHFNLNPKHTRKIKSVACTGLGTYYGKMELSEAARQMALAYRNILNPPKQISWHFASVRQNQVGFGGYEGLKKVKASSESAASRRGVAAAMDKLALATYSSNRDNDEDSTADQPTNTNNNICY